VHTTCVEGTSALEPIEWWKSATPGSAKKRTGGFLDRFSASRIRKEHPRARCGSSRDAGFMGPRGVSSCSLGVVGCVAMGRRWPLVTGMVCMPANEEKL